MDKEALVARLRQQRTQFEQELRDRIVHIENIDASIRILEGQETSQPKFPPQNPFEGVPIEKITTETYLTIGRLLVDNKNNVQTQGVGNKLLVKELNHRIGEVERIINSFDSDADRLNGRGDPHTLGYLRQISEDRDRLRIELEFYKDIIEAL